VCCVPRAACPCVLCVPLGFAPATIVQPRDRCRKIASYRVAPTRPATAIILLTYLARKVVSKAGKVSDRAESESPNTNWSSERAPISGALQPRRCFVPPVGSGRVDTVDTFHPSPSFCATRAVRPSLDTCHVTERDTKQAYSRVYDRRKPRRPRHGAPRRPS